MKKAFILVLVILFATSAFTQMPQESQK